MMQGGCVIKWTRLYKWNYGTLVHTGVSYDQNIWCTCKLLYTSQILAQEHLLGSIPVHIIDYNCIFHRFYADTDTHACIADIWRCTAYLHTYDTCIYTYGDVSSNAKNLVAEFKTYFGFRLDKSENCLTPNQWLKHAAVVEGGCWEIPSANCTQAQRAVADIATFLKEKGINTCLWTCMDTGKNLVTYSKLWFCERHFEVEEMEITTLLESCDVRLNSCH